MPIRMSGLNSGLDTEAIIGELMSAHKMKLTKIENKQTTLEWTKEKWQSLNTKLYDLYTTKLSKLRLASTYQSKRVTSSNESKVKATGTSKAVNGTHSIQVKQLASAQHTTGSQLAAGTTASTELTDLGYAIGDEITITTGDGVTHSFTVEGDSTIASFAKFADGAGLNANFDAGQRRLYLSSKESGKENSFQIMVNGGTEGLEKLGLGSDAKTVEATDAIFTYNGVEYTESSNTVTVNGLTLQLSGTTANYGEDNAETITLTVDTDVEAAYNAVKDFITSYNEILKEMNDLYYAKSARGYDPLTDEQKDAMSDSEVEKWEDKIKGALLRNDGTLGGLLSGMKSALGGSVEVNGQKYSLSSFGISTSTDYTEKGLLHIYGDTSDATYASKDDKLKAALINDPETTVKALTGIFDSLYSEMTKRMAATSMSSALTFYNDKQFTKLEDQYKKEYSKMETKLTDIEDRYYNQFTAMETAMAKLNQQQSALAGMLGSGS